MRSLLELAEIATTVVGTACFAAAARGPLFKLTLLAIGGYLIGYVAVYGPVLPKG